MEEVKNNCCPPGSEPQLTIDYQPKGVTETVEDLPIYVVGQGEKAVIVCIDIIGVDSGRTKLICDQLADAGYLVVMPDFFRKDTYKEKELLAFFGIFKIIKRARKNPASAIHEDFNKCVFPFLEKKGAKKIGMMGFCWGAYVIFNISASEKISVGVTFHPTLHRYKESAEDLAKKPKCPQMLLPAGNDPKVVKEGGKVEKILKEKFGDDAVIKTFPEMKHGFVNRGDLKDPKVARDVKEAMDMGMAFLKKHL